MATLPSDVKFGKVVGQFLLAIGDSDDPGSTPDGEAAVGTVKFVPRVPNQRALSPLATVVSRPPICHLGADGVLYDGQVSPGVWLVTGRYDVHFDLKNIRLNPITILVTEEHNAVTPLDLALAIPPVGDPLGDSQYAELSDRIGGLEVIAGEGLTIEQLLPALLGIFTPGDDINIYQMDPPNDDRIIFNVMGLDAIRDDITALEALTSTPSYTDEQARDAVSTMLVQGANITLTKDDAGDTVTIAATVPSPSSVPQVIDAKTASYTLQATDVGKLLTFNSTSAMQLLIPTDASMTWAVGTRVDVLVLNTGLVTAAAVTPGTTSVVGTPSLAARARYSAFSVVKIGANSWAVIGDMA